MPKLYWKSGVTCQSARPRRIEQKMNIAKPAVQWLFLDLNAFFASCEQQEAPALRGKPVIVVQTLTDSAVAIAASYAAKAFGIKTGTLVREARRLCPEVIPVEANHRLYTDYHERILKAVDTCLPVEKVMSIDEMACRLMGTERQVMVARELALKVKRALREQVGECLTCSIGIAPNVFLRLPRFSGRLVGLRVRSWSWWSASRLRRLSASGIPDPNAVAPGYTNPRCS